MMDERTSAEEHEQLLEWARRQQQLLTSISDFAASITRIRDHSEALHELVSKARLLIQTDMVYLSLNGTDGSGYTNIVATDGVWSEEYRRLRMPLGAGVLGKVAKFGGVAQTADYQNDSELVHDAEVDRIVAGEGVRAILGAPMRSEEGVIGALLAANRFPGKFSTEQVFIAQTLANLAGVAIENQARVDELEATIDELRGQTTDADRELAEERRLARVDEVLLSVMGRGAGFTELGEGMSRVMGREVQIVDLTVRHDLRNAVAKIGDAERPLVMLSARAGEPMTSMREDGAPFAVMAATQDEAAVGAVMVEGELLEKDAAVLERCARVLGVFLSGQHRERTAIVRRRRELIAQLLAAGARGLNIAVVTQLRELGIAESEPFRILVIDGSESTLGDFQHRLDLDFGLSLLYGEFDGQIVSLMPEEAFERIRAMFDARGARGWGGMLVGHSPRLHMLEIVPEEYALVLRVLNAARQSGHTRTLVSLDSYGVIGAFLSKVTIEPTKQAIVAALGPVLDYDAEHGTDLADTASAYLDAAHSVAKTAERMHVHANTVRQRLDRLAQLLGADWAEGQRGLDHHILLAAHRLVGPYRPR
ncbi:helix-turn-helix domain-containing protein [Gulosibacter chungangensis]|uniref:GAF domain-containing protein n=1 Tax=Gulosibacter chungangensis TaxID=979746 RepID=A0A7J5B7G2_9MICO|nr:helix-turn-helix domain-containing protein [Gulosibacter chungangensis]KAB1640811.1 GAF domain-containing protein [Gulosibacter chungangensis]